MHFLAIWQRRYFLTFREQEREAGSKYSPGISVAVFLERARQKKNTNQKNQTYFQEYQKYRLNCDTYALKPVYNMIRSLLRWSVCLRLDPISSLFFRNISVVAPGSSLQPELFTQESRSDFPVWNILWFIGLRKRCSGLKRDPFTFVTLKDPKQRPPATKCIVPKWFVTFEPLILFIRSNK